MTAEKFTTNNGEEFEVRDPAPGPDDEGRMSLEDAEQEADMIKVFLKENFQQPTEENYAKASRAIDKLIKRADDPTITVKAAASLLIILEGIFRVYAAIPLAIISTVSGLADVVVNENEAINNYRKDAQASLDRLKEGADRLQKRFNITPSQNI